MIDQEFEARVIALDKAIDAREHPINPSEVIRNANKFFRFLTDQEQPDEKTE